MMMTGNSENKLKMDSGDGFHVEGSSGTLSRLATMRIAGKGLGSEPERINPVGHLKSKGIIDADPYGRLREYYNGWAADPPANEYSQVLVPEYAGAHNVSGMNTPPHANFDNFKEGFSLLILEKEWNDYIKLKKNSDDMWKNSAIAGATMAIAGQAAAGVIAHGLADPTLPPWVKNAIKISVGVGLGATAAGLGMRGLKRLAQRVLIKTGAISTASGIILPIAMSFPPVAAWTVGVVAGSVVAASVVLA